MTGAGLGRKQCGASAGWEGLWGGCMLEICRVQGGNGQLSQIPAVAGWF